MREIRTGKELENNPAFIWGAIYDGDLIYASDINQGIYVLDLQERGKQAPAVVSYSKRALSRGPSFALTVRRSGPLGFE